MRGCRDFDGRWDLNERVDERVCTREFLKGVAYFFNCIADVPSD